MRARNVHHFTLPDHKPIAVILLVVVLADCQGLFLPGSRSLWGRFSQWWLALGVWDLGISSCGLSFSIRGGFNRASWAFQTLFFVSGLAFGLALPAGFFGTGLGTLDVVFGAWPPSSLNSSTAFKTMAPTNPRNPCILHFDLVMGSVGSMLQ